MKQYITFLVAILCTAFSFGESPYTITFTGNGGTLNKVRVENLTKRTFVEMNATDALRLVLTTKIDYLDANAEKLKVYPNPMNQNCMIEFENESSGNVNLKIVDLSGKIIFTYNRFLESGEHNYQLSGLAAGVYFVSLKTSNKTYNNKIVSNSQLKGNMCFLDEMFSQSKQADKPENKIQKAKAEQSTTVDMQFSPGDQLKFIGYATGFANNTVYASPTASGTYSFNFVAPFYRINGNTIATSQPCFVDIMFSVSDVNYKGVDNLSNSDFVVKENSAVVSPSESFRYIKSINTVPYKIKTVIMIDNSTSIGSNLTQIKNAAKAMVNNIGKNQEIAIYSFSEGLVLMSSFTNNVAQLTSAINSISLGFPSTNLFGSYIEGVNKWTDLYTVDKIEKGFLVLFTDGDDTQASSTLQQAISARGQKSTYIIGLGSDISPTNLSQLANPSPYYAASSVADLEQIFLNIQKDIYKYANSFYWLNYMSPKRTGNHTLEISVKSNTNTNTDATYTGQFSAANFFGVQNKGVYANTTVAEPYGISSQQVTMGNTFDIKAVSYQALNPPAYKWTSENTNLATVIQDIDFFNKAQVNAKGVGSVAITIKDTANNFTKQVLFSVIAGLPTVTTTVPTNLTQTSAICGGNIVSNGGAAITISGVCWSTSQNPTIDLTTKTTSGTTSGTFSGSITGLTANTTYYIRAYATNNIGTSYGEEINFVSNDYLKSTFTDSRDNNVYKTVTIGTQVWMAENLRYLPRVSAPTLGSISTPYYYVNGYYGSNLTDARANNAYSYCGVLYNWEAAKIACPVGWHLPTDAEWTQLENFLANNGCNYDGSIGGGGEKIAKAMSVNWGNNSTVAGSPANTDFPLIINKSGFTAMGAGARINTSFIDYWSSIMGIWWSLSEIDASNANCRTISPSSPKIYKSTQKKEQGFSVRCVKD